jgi:glycosyltransferase involved in cell wall biosynthesis
MGSAMSAPNVHILLGTYNGARYVQQQLDSIRAQTYTRWTLLIRDDGSQDNTVDILSRAAESDPRIELLPDDGRHLGCVGNFSKLAAEAFGRGAAYVAFADQDDVWHASKLDETMRLMLEAERSSGGGKPVLVHTDLDVIDPRGVSLHRSFMQFQRLHHTAERALPTLLVQNFVTGSTVVVNRPLLSIGLPVPGQVLMHDWWFALCAAATGAIEFLPKRTVSYRRHDDNVVTVRGFWTTMNPFRTSWRQLWSEGVSNHTRIVSQADALLSRLVLRRPAQADESAIREFIELHNPHRRSPSRVMWAIRLRLVSQTLPRTVVLYLRLLVWTRLGKRPPLPVPATTLGKR